MMCHYAILDASGDAEATTWLEPVTDAQYTARTGRHQRRRSDP